MPDLPAETENAVAVQALRARQLGIDSVIVLEQVEELPLALEAAEKLGVESASVL